MQIFLWFFAASYFLVVVGWWYFAVYCRRQLEHAPFQNTLVIEGMRLFSATVLPANPRLFSSHMITEKCDQSGLPATDQWRNSP